MMMMIHDRHPDQCTLLGPGSPSAHGLMALSSSVFLSSLALWLAGPNHRVSKAAGLLMEVEPVFLHRAEHSVQLDMCCRDGVASRCSSLKLPNPCSWGPLAQVATILELVRAEGTQVVGRSSGRWHPRRGPRASGFHVSSIVVADSHVRDLKYTSIIRDLEKRCLSLPPRTIRRENSKCKSGESIAKCLGHHRHACLPNLLGSRSSQHLASLPAGGPDVLDPLAGMVMSVGLVLAHEWVRIAVLLQVAKRVVHLAVLGLVGANVQQQVSHGPLVLRHVPIFNGDLGCRELLPARQLPGIEVADGLGVGPDRLLLQVPDEAMTDLWRQEVGQEHAVVEDPLGSEDHEFHEPARLGHLHEGEQMHSLIVCLLQERLDPAVVSLQPSQAVEMSQAGPNHAGDPGHALQKEEADEPLAFGHGSPPSLGGQWRVFAADRVFSVVCVPGAGIHAESEKPDHAQRDPVSPIFDFALRDLDCVHIFLRISVEE